MDSEKSETSEASEKREPSEKGGRGEKREKRKPFHAFSNQLILLDDCNGDPDRYLGKIASVLSATPILARNRLISDLLSFAHLLVSRVRAEASPGSALGRSIYALGKVIGDDIFSKKLAMKDYPRVFAKWMTGIGEEKSVLPFHLKPYTWDEERWETETADLAARFIYELLMAIERICGAGSDR
jgi:hypothetical protein